MRAYVNSDPPLGRMQNVLLIEVQDLPLSSPIWPPSGDLAELA